MKTILASLIGTTFMTIYSYAKAHKEEKQFEEPKMLGKLIHRHPSFSIYAKKARGLGWLLHYGVGLSFASVYRQVWKKQIVKPSAVSGAALGLVSGATGILIWDAAFQLHPHEPKTHQRKFYKQLLVAHVIFGTTAAITYKFLTSTQKQNTDS